MPLNFSCALLSPNTVLIDAMSPHISCYWCRKIAVSCDGQRTLQDLCDLLYLPLPVLQKLAQKALDQGWLMMLGAPSAEANCFWQRVLGLIGQQREGLLEKAARMTRQQPGNISAGTISDFLIAVELLLSENERPHFISQLDQIRQDFVLSA